MLALIVSVEFVHARLAPALSCKMMAALTVDVYDYRVLQNFIEALTRLRNRALGVRGAVYHALLYAVSASVCTALPVSTIYFWMVSVAVLCGSATATPSMLPLLPCSARVLTAHVHHRRLPTLNEWRIVRTAWLKM